MFVLVECNIPDVVTGLLAEVYKAIIILIPIGIVLFGTIDFVKAIAAKDEAAISASGKTFISRLITGCLTFFVLTIVTWIFQTLIGSVGGSSSAMDCALKILGGTAKYQSNAVTDKMNKEICYGTQYGSCMSGNTSPTASEDCNKAANSICGTDKTIKTTSPTHTQEQKTTIPDSYSCFEKYKNEINTCIKQNKENSAVSFKTYDMFYQSCMDDFSNFEDACTVYEDCMWSQGYDENAYCNTIKYSTKYNSCSTQYQNYKYYLNKYNGYNIDFNSNELNNFCNTYAEKAIDAQNNGDDSYTKNNIETYCRKLYCKD